MSVPTYDHFIGPVLRYLVRQPNGARLAGLMIDHEVGVTSRPVRIPKIDGDYFDEELA